MDDWTIGATIVVGGRVFSIERLTDTQIIASDGYRYYRATGRRVGKGSRYSPTPIARLPLDGEVEGIQRQTALVSALDPTLRVQEERMAPGEMLTPQPDPVCIDISESVTDWLLGCELHPIAEDLIRARREQGRVRYGTELYTHNGRNPTLDALQEAVDLVLYLAQESMELGSAHDDDLDAALRIVRRLAVRASQ